MPEHLKGEFILSQKKDQEQVPAHTSSSREAQTEPVISEKHQTSKPHFYSAFSKYPKGIRFQTQEQDEEVILLLRQHFITNVPWILGLFLLALLPFLLFIIVPIFFSSIIIHPALIFIATAFYYLIIFSLGVLYFSIWYFNVGIVTNKRLLDLDVHNILSRVLSEARLNAIQDVTITQVGGIRSIFNYGDIDVQTEALKQNIEYYRIPQPNAVRIIIGNLVVHRK